MIHKYASVPATDEHVQQLALHMAQNDKRELWCLTHSTPLEGLQDAVRASMNPTTWMEENPEQPLSLYGVVRLSLLPRIGCPWMLAHEDLPKHGRAFARESRKWMTEQRQYYRFMYNYVGAWHTRSIRWLKWLGFTIEPALPFGVEQQLWHRIWIRGL